MLLMIHSIWRWVVLVVALVTVAKAVFGWLGRQEWGSLDDRLGMVFTTTIDIEVLLGLLVWVTMQAWTLVPAAAFEHPVVMLLAVAAAHVGRTRSRRADEATSKHRTSAIFYLVSLLLILAGIVTIQSVVR